MTTRPAKRSLYITISRTIRHIIRCTRSTTKGIGSILMSTRPTPRRVRPVTRIITPTINNYSVHLNVDSEQTSQPN